jgi:beta-aspartyl-dipeptidase (metallo-type)
MITLIQGGHLYGPEDLGIQDLLVINGKIERLAPGIKIPHEIFPGMEVVNATHKLIVPGLIDQHVHIIGAGGSGGFLTRTKEVYFHDLVKAGITTVVGTLGTDTISRSMKTLLAKAKAMILSGINTYTYAGSVLFPPVTLTGSVETDIVLITEIIGVKLGLGETVFPRPDLRELENTIIEARRGASFTGKSGVVHIHLAISALEWIDSVESILKARDIPYSQVVFTHVNKSRQLMDRATAYARNGGFIDLTTNIRPPERPTAVKPSIGLKRYLEVGGSPKGITFSSDGNASRVLDKGVVDYTRVGALLEEFQDAVQNEGVPLPQALSVVTSNVADRIGIAKERGSLREGYFADLALFTDKLELTDLMSGGRWLLRDGTVVGCDPLDYL